MHARPRSLFLSAPLQLALLQCLACGSAPCPPEASLAPPARPPATQQEVSLENAQEAPLPTHGVRVEGAPDVPDALRARLAQYQHTRSASLVGLSPEGREVLIQTRFAETSQVHRLRAPLGARAQLTYGEEPVREAVWSAPGALHFLRDVGGDEDHQVYRFDLQSGATQRLTDGESKSSSLIASADGSLIAYANNGRNGADMDVIVQGEDGANRRLYPREGYWLPLDFSPDNTKLLVLNYRSITESELWEIDLSALTSAEGAAEQAPPIRRISPEGMPASYELAIYDATGERVYVVTERDQEFRQLYEVDLPRAPLEEPSLWRLLTPELPWNVEELALSGDGRTLAFVVNVDSFSQLYAMDTRTRRIRDLHAPAGVIRDLRFAARADVLAITLESPTSAADVYLTATRRPRFVRWTESEIGGLDASRFVTPEAIHVTSFDGRAIPALYYRPRGAEGPAPVLISIHGGPESQARPVFSPLTQYLASERGVAILVPNVRGSDGYGRTYLGLDNGRLRQDSVRDIGALLDWIDTQDGLDASRVAVMGGSYGGFMVLATLAEYGARVRAGIDVVGISHFVTFLENTRGYRRDLRRAEYGDERDPEMRSFLDSISPLTRADQIRSALFVAQGANDPRVPVSESDQLVEAVRGAGNDVWYMLAYDEGHGFAKKSNRDLYLELSALFLEENLLSQAAP